MIRYGSAGMLLLGGLLIWRGTAWLHPLPVGKVFLLGICGICGFGTFYTLAIAASAPGMAIVVASTPMPAEGLSPRAHLSHTRR